MTAKKTVLRARYRALAKALAKALVSEATGAPAYFTPADRARIERFLVAYWKIT